MPERAENGDTVRVHYTGMLENGEVFDTSEGGEPLEYKVGAGEVIPAFEGAVRGMSAIRRTFHYFGYGSFADAVRGMTVGERRRVRIEPENAYGPHREGLVAQIPLEAAQFPTEPEVGANFLMPLPDGTQLEVVVTELTDTHVTIDGNHPLAGKTLIFDVELVEIKKK